MLTKEQLNSGSIEDYQKLTIEDIEEALKQIVSEEELKPSHYLGNNLWELPGNIITNENGYKEYLKHLNI